MVRHSGPWPPVNSLRTMACATARPSPSSRSPLRRMTCWPPTATAEGRVSARKSRARDESRRRRRTRCKLQRCYMSRPYESSSFVDPSFVDFNPALFHRHLFTAHRLLQARSARSNPTRASDARKDADIDHLDELPAQPEPLHDVAAAAASSAPTSNATL